MNPIKLVKQIIEMASNDPHRMSKVANEHWKSHCYHPRSLANNILDNVIRRISIGYTLRNPEEDLSESNLSFRHVIEDDSLARLGSNELTVSIIIGITGNNMLGPWLKDIKQFPLGILSIPYNNKDVIFTFASIKSTEFDKESKDYKTPKGRYNTYLCESSYDSIKSLYFDAVSLSSYFNFLSEKEKLEVVDSAFNSMSNFDKVREEFLSTSVKLKLFGSIINHALSWDSYGIMFDIDTLSFLYKNTVNPEGTVIAKEIVQIYKDNNSIEHLNNLKANQVVRGLISEDQYQSYDGYMKLIGKGYMGCETD